MLSRLAGAEDGKVNDEEMALRKAGEAAARRCEAARWLRQMEPAAVEALPEEPSEEEFCAALRNGLVLCNVLNRVNPGAVPKVVENPVAAVHSSDGAAQSAIQYFENMRNFLVAVGEMNLLTFEASDIEKGGSSMKVVDCILCLKGYHEWKLAGGIGIWRYGGIVKIASSKRLPSYLSRGGGLSNQMLEFIHLLAEVSLEESKVAEAQSSLFQHFVLRVAQAFLMEWSETDESPLDDMVLETLLEQAYREFSMLLASQHNQARSLLKRMMKDENETRTRLELIEAISRSLKGNSESLSSSLQLSCGSGTHKQWKDGGGLEQHQKELEKLKSSFNVMKLQVESTRAKWEEDLRRLENYFEAQNHNSSSYHKLLEENRMLYNQVQDLKGSIRVYCRVKPFLKVQSDERSAVDHIGENGEIMIVNPQKQGKDGRKVFSFNKIFGPNASQSEVFADTQPLIRSVMDGYNVCIFAYGQTGSGKTYTMSGPDMTAEETWGVNYRSLNDLFDISQTRAETITYDVKVQMIEIYNEQVRDLLMADGSNRRLEIRNSSYINGLNIPDANLVPVRCAQDVLNLMRVGQRNRAVGATALNERSSRSHSVLTVHVQGKEVVSGSILRGCLHLVDLAGSERVDKSEATGERLTEAKHINKSLSALGDVIAALAQKSSHIPYRNSKLTQVLQDALGGQAKTLMFVHINPEVDAFSETMSTLKFAERVASIELGAARVNKEAGQVKDLKEEIAKLKSALDDKEHEVAQLKDLASRVTSEMRAVRTRLPLTTSMSLKPEIGQDPRVDSCSSEIRSSSSGKQRRFLSPSLSERELDDKSSIITREGYMSARKLKTPSPTVRSSLSAERVGIARSAEKAERMDCTPVSKFQVTAKVWVSSSRNTCPSILAPQNSQKFQDVEENRSSKRSTGVRESTSMNRSGSRTKSRKEEQRADQSTHDSSERENEVVNSNSGFSSNRKVKKFRPQAMRQSQSIDLRASVREMEPLTEGRHHRNKPSYADRTNVPLSETRRSVSLRDGKIAPV